MFWYLLAEVLEQVMRAVSLIPLLSSQERSKHVEVVHTPNVKTVVAATGQIAVQLSLWRASDI